jgi:hypothetical protein
LLELLEHVEAALQKDEQARTEPVEDGPWWWALSPAPVAVGVGSVREG